eukprot:s2937_g5.t1
MKSAYVGEFTGFLKGLDDLRVRMETWYALRLEDEQVTGDRMTEYEKIMNECDATITKIMTSMRVAPPKATAKSAAAPAARAPEAGLATVKKE